jgi:hypothetical protein
MTRLLEMLLAWDHFGEHHYLDTLQEGQKLVAWLHPNSNRRVFSYPTLLSYRLVMSVT